MDIKLHKLARTTPAINVATSRLAVTPKAVVALLARELGAGSVTTRL